LDSLLQVGKVLPTNDGKCPIDTDGTGALSSRVSNATANEVRLSGNFCGTIQYEYGKYLEPHVLEQTLTHLYKQIINSLLYARECYSAKEPERITRCQIFTRPVLPYTVSKDSPCPFSPEICKTPDSNIFLDTGYLDSIDHLGWDTGPHFQLRYTLSCAPLVTQGFTEVVDTDEVYMLYKYGNISENEPYLFRQSVGNQTPDAPRSLKQTYEI
jgi:hypothetical protein